jgi:hypothetical protein
MMRISKLFGSVAAGAFCGAIGVGILNSMWTVNDVGMVQRLLPWPLSAWWVWASGGGILGLVRWWQRTEINSQVEAWSQLNNFSYQDYVKKEDYPTAENLGAFKAWHEGSNYLHGNWEGTIVEMLDYENVKVGRDNKTYTTQTVVVLPGRGVGLPDFYLSANELGFRVLQSLGIQGMKFAEGERLGPEGTALVRRFNERYRLFPGKLQFMHDVSLIGSERAGEVELVRALFTLDMLRFFADRPGWCIEKQGDDLAIWKNKVVVPPQQRQQFLRDALETDRALHQASTLPPTEGLEAVYSQPDPAAVQKNFFRIALHMFAGFFLGAVFAFPGFFLIDSVPWSMAAFFVPLFVGALLGLYFGMRRSLRD